MSCIWKAEYVIKGLQISEEIKVYEYTFKPSEKNETLLEFYFEAQDDSLAENYSEEEKEFILDALLFQNIAVTARRKELQEVKRKDKPTIRVIKYIQASRVIVKKGLDKDQLKKSIETLRKIKENHVDEMLTMSLRWFRKGRTETDIYDRFISLWVSFNALYQKYDVSDQKAIEQLVYDIFNSSEAQKILDSFSSESIEIIKESDLELTRGKYKGKVKEGLDKSIEERDYLNILKFVLLKLYSLRNDIFHSYVLYGDRQKRRLIKISSDILIKILPRILLYRINNI